MAKTRKFTEIFAVPVGVMINDPIKMLDGKDYRITRIDRVEFISMRAMKVVGRAKLCEEPETTKSNK
ncbi:hypothetical protein [Bacillus paranthracis]|uniref:hypothetical protein n=1 Tax=Bacillus paranthracis TaxID=2026186 RepID=UPI0022E6D7FE|nr:hypothetical protein [Bacillus paranthracis]